MKIFISWSGQRSKYVAESLRLWLPKVLQVVKPWMSNEDIDSGKRWSVEIMNELEISKFGIICITPENQTSPWIMFESGALSKTLEQTFLVPLLFDLTPSQLISPLSQFQSRLSDKDGILKMLKTINNTLLEHQMLDGELEEIFEVWWPRLEVKLSDCPPYTGPVSQKRTHDDYFKELIDNSREQLRREDLRLERMIETDVRTSKMVELMEKLAPTLSILDDITGSKKKDKDLSSIAKEILKNIKGLEGANEDFFNSIVAKSLGAPNHIEIPEK